MLQVLRMSGNPLSSLAERAFRAAGLINLQKAYLGNCSLARIDATAFEGLVILIELDLTHNHLRNKNLAAQICFNDVLVIYNYNLIY